MNKELNVQDYKNLLALIAIAPIKGNEATTVAVLQQKLNTLISESPEEKAEDIKPEEKA